jgi:hypothetical protein
MVNKPLEKLMNPLGLCSIFLGSAIGSFVSSYMLRDYIPVDKQEDCKVEQRIEYPKPLNS